MLAAGAAAGLTLDGRRVLAGDTDAEFYSVPPVGNVHLLHITDVHAQLLPMRYREPHANLGVGAARGRPPHLVGEALLTRFGIPAGTRAAHAFTHLDFDAAARRYGKTGGFAHVATLVKRLRTERPGALLLDGGDTWQGSATALWTRGADMVEACLELGVDVMTGHWEFTYGADRVRELIDGPMRDRIAFVAQNIRTRDFDDEVFPGYVTRDCNGVRVAIIGQAFPYMPIANPRHLVPDWAFGIREESLQQTVETVRADGAQVVVLLSHNGMDVDLEMASRIAGLTAILGGHTHDGVPVAIEVANPGGKTLVTNGGSNGKFVGVLDLDVRDRQVRDYRYRLVPVFSDLLPPDAAMQSLVGRVRAPYRDRLAEPLAVTEGTLYRRGNFNGTFDQVIVDALMRVKDVPIAFSPGFRWGASLLAGDTITREDVMAQTAITYPAVTVTPMTGERIKAVLEDVADNLFHPHPYYQQGGDMVRVGGLTFSCEPRATVGQRIGDLRLGDKPLDPARTYPVAGWASVAEGATGEPIWDVVETYLRDRKVITPPKLNTPRLLGVDGDPGFSPPP